MNYRKLELRKIIIENFKSFKGKHNIGPLGSHTAVIGVEQAGKSNLVHAISFVLGKSFKDHDEALQLIHGAPYKKSANSCSVSVHLELYHNGENTGTVIKIKRIILDDRVEHFVDDECVSEDNYLQILRTYRIDMNSPIPTIISENKILEIIHSSPKDLMYFLEKVSLTNQYKLQYDTLMKNIPKLKSEISDAKLLISNTERKPLALKKRMETLELIKEKRKTLFLMKLYYLEKGIRILENELGCKRHDLVKLQNLKEEIKEDLKGKEFQLRQLWKNITVLEKELREVKTNTLIERQEQVEALSPHINDDDIFTENFLKLSQDKKKLCIDTLEKNTKALTNQLAQLQQHKEVLLKDIKEFKLSNEQWEQYTLLLQQYFKESAQFSIQFSEILRSKRNSDEEKVVLELKHDSLKNILELNRKKLNLITEQNKKTNDRIQVAKEQNQKFQEEIVVINEKIQSQNSKKHKLDQEFEHLKDRNNIGERPVKQQRIFNVVETLQMHFEGVFGRLVDLCEAKSDKYQIAVDRALIGHKNSIVVDSEKTASKCLQFILFSKMKSETFLPIDILEPPKLKVALRWPNTKFIFNVINFPEQFQKAVFFAVENTLVCATKTDADSIWESLKPQNEEERREVDVIVLDGTLYHRDDYVSAPLQNWQPLVEAAFEEMLDSREDKEAEYHTFMTHCEASKSNYNYQIRILQSKIEVQEDFIKSELKDLHSQFFLTKEIEEQISMLESDIKLIDNKIEAILNNSEYVEANRVEKLLSELKQKIFIEFCQEINVYSFEEFEDLQRKFLKHDKLSQCKDDILKVEALLECEWQNIPLSEDQDKKKKFEDSAAKLRQRLEKFENKPLVLTNPDLENQLVDVRNLYSQLQKCVRNTVGHLTKASENVFKVLQEIIHLEQMINLKKADWNSVLIESLCAKLELLNRTQDGSPNYSDTLKNINYKDLPFHLRNLNLQEEYEKEVTNLEVSIKSFEEKLLEFNTDIMGSSSINRLQAVIKVNEIWNTKLSDLQQNLAKMEKDFNICKKIRYDRYTAFIADVINGLKIIYRWIYGETATVYLDLKEAETFSCEFPKAVDFIFRAPVRGARNFNNLGFTDKFIATATILFALSLGTRSPLIILDGIDNNLNDSTVNHLSVLVKKIRERCQLLVVSNNEQVYCELKTFVGISFEKDEAGIPCSFAVAKDLSEYPE